MMTNDHDYEGTGIPLQQALASQRAAPTPTCPTNCAHNYHCEGCGKGLGSWSSRCYTCKPIKDIGGI